MASLSNNNNNNNLLLLQRVDMMLSSEVLLLRSSAFGADRMQKIADFTYEPIQKELTIEYLTQAADAWFGSSNMTRDTIKDNLPTGVTQAFTISKINPKRWDSTYECALISRKNSTVYLYSPNLGCIFFTPRPSTTTTTQYYYFSNVKEFMYQVCTMYLHHNEYSRSALHEWIGDISTLDESPTCKPPTAAAIIAK